jgi:hypothetical protein
MPDINYLHNVGSLVALATGIAPESSSGGTINGGAIDRIAHGLANSAVLHQMVGADSGAPTTISVQTKLQDSADGAAFADFKPDGVNVAATAALTAVSSENSVAIDLTTARRFIRPVMTVGFTGGTTPAALVASDLVLGGERTLAAV